MGKMMAAQTRLVSIVTPVFNEQEALPAFHAGLTEALEGLPYEFHFLYVNDGSVDQTAATLEALQSTDPRVEVLELSRNFGHQAALTAGMAHASGDYVITMDGDGQHPPALIKEMLALAEQGYELVLTQRVGEKKAGFKQWTSRTFYRFINWIGDTDITPGGADFRLMSRTVVDALNSMPEHHRFLRGMVAWAGYRKVILPFQPPERLAGTSKYTLRKMLRLSTDAVFSFSLVPLYISTTIGFLFLILALLESIYVLSFWVSGRQDMLVPGWSSTMFVLLIVGGCMMVALGIIGLYIGYIFQEVKGRPVFLVRKHQLAEKYRDATGKTLHEE
jgi:glycosyltransferase involved in cell wall biosynthesis